MRTTVWFVRAGQSQFNQQRRYQGQTDSPLTTMGIAQAQAIVVQLQRQNITALYVAPQQSTLESAAYLAQARNLVPHPDVAWADQQLGAVSGLTRREALEQHFAVMRMRMHDPINTKTNDSESIAEVSQRCLAAWQHLLTVHRGQRIAVVTQALPIQMILCAVLGTPLAKWWTWRVDNGSVTGVDVYGDTVIVRCINQSVRLTRNHIDAARHSTHDRSSEELS
jgi:broad specificity phosphatase PhoE